MARKKKRHASRRYQPTIVTTPERRLELARAALEEGRFREAIGGFKALLKDHDDPQWRTELAVAYQGRVRELVAKGMLKEAVAIGEVRRELCPDAAPDPGHLALLLRSGQVEQVVEVYRTAGKTLPQREFASLTARLAALHLSDAAGLDTALEAGHPLLVDGAAARAALAAWCGGDDPGCAEALSAIPFRSPYRDWVQVLKALLKVDQDPAAAERTLARVTADSPFFGVAEAVRLALLPESAFASALADVGPATRRFAAMFRGWSESRLTLWRELRDAAKDSQKLLELLYRQRKRLGEAWVRRQGLPLLVANLPKCLRGSPLFGGRPASEREYDQIFAWDAEQDGDHHDVFDAWCDVIDHLRARGTPAPDSDDALRIALIQRRFDSRWNMLSYPDNDPFETEKLRDQAREQFEQSLDLDPGWRPGYTRLIAHYRAQGQAKDARRILARALELWPDQIDVLQEALETAVTADAFKKAAGYARKILALDPINSSARSRLFEAHLAHARKQFRKRRHDLALRELDIAQDWARGVKAVAALMLLRGFATLAGDQESDREQGLALLRQAVTELGDGLTGRLALALEAERLDQSVDSFIKRLRLPKVMQPEADDLLGFMRLLREALDVGQKPSPATLREFEPALKRAAKRALSSGDMEAVCETLRRCELVDVRRVYAAAALERWPGRPVFELHAFEAKYTGFRPMVQDADVNRLHIAYEQAQESGDTRVAMQLGKILENLLPPSFGGPVFDPFEDGPIEPEQGGETIADIKAMIEDVVDFSGNMPELDELKRMLGPDQMGALLDEMMNGISPGEPALVPPRPPRRRPVKRKRKKAKPKKATAPPSDGDKPEDQGPSPSDSESGNSKSDDSKSDDSKPGSQQMDLF